MKCPIELENPEKLLAYSSRELGAEEAALVEQHVAQCTACREWVRGQGEVWEALGAWQALPVSADFNRRLYERIDQEGSRWSLFMRPFRRLLVPLAASAGVIVVAGMLLERPSDVSPEPGTNSAQVESLRPEQVEHALDDLDMLSKFSLAPHGDASPQM